MVCRFFLTYQNSGRLFRWSNSGLLHLWDYKHTVALVLGFSTYFPIAAQSRQLCCRGLQQLWPWKGGLFLSHGSPELVGLGSWFQQLLLPTWEVPDFQVQSRNSWKHWEFPDELTAHLMEVRGQARHRSDLFCFFRDECVKCDVLVMCNQNFLLEVRNAKEVLQWAGGDSFTCSQGCHGPLLVRLTLSQHSHCGTKLLHTQLPLGFLALYVFEIFKLSSSTLI